jgi:hypothetical protein
MLANPFRHEFDIGTIIIVTKKYFLPKVSPRGNVMRVARSYDRCYSGHVKRIPAEGGVEDKYTVPITPTITPTITPS